MGEKQNQRVALTKRLLQESLLQLMKEKNIQNISVKELCEASGINRSTFYNHYTRPEDVLSEIENSVIADLNSIWEAQYEEGNWRMDKRIEMLCIYIKDHQDLFQLLLRDSDTSSGFPTLLMDSTHVRISHDQILTSDGKEESPESKKLMATFISNGSYYLIRQWILEDIPKTPKEVGAMIYYVSTHGWNPPK